MDYGTLSESEWDALSEPKKIDREIDLEDMRNKFWSHVYRWGDRCWLWAGPVTPTYHPNGNISRLDGRFHYKGKTYYAHRACYQLEVGEIPEAYEVHHKCNEPLCVRPEHLEAISYAEHLVRHGGKRGVSPIVRRAMEQLSEEEENPSLYTKEQKARRWAYLRHYYRRRAQALLLDGQTGNREGTTDNIGKDRR